jgi:hypothetical protein
MHGWVNYQSKILGLMVISSNYKFGALIVFVSNHNTRKLSIFGNIITRKDTNIAGIGSFPIDNHHRWVYGGAKMLAQST